MPPGARGLRTSAGLLREAIAVVPHWNHIIIQVLREGVNSSQLAHMTSEIYSQRQAIKLPSLLFFFLRFLSSSIVMNCKQLRFGQGLSHKSAFNKLSRDHRSRESPCPLPCLLLYGSLVLRSV